MCYGLSIASIGSSYLQLDVLQALQNDEFIADQTLDTNDMREGLLALVYIIVYIISIVTFIQWFRRAYYNMNLRTNCEHSEGWAAGSWFVPILCLYRPYKIMEEMSNEATRILKTKSESFKNIDISTLIGAWWALWILANYVGKYITRTVFKADTIDNLIHSTMAEMVGSAIDIPLAIVTVIMIKRYAEKEEELFNLDHAE